MKRYFSLLAIPLIFSCQMQIPTSVSVKTDAEYAFSIGTYSKSLSEYISVNSITDMMKPSEDGPSFNIYDYNPGEKANGVQQFLLELPIKDIDVTPTKFLKDTDFTKNISENQSFSQLISVPQLGEMDGATEVELPELSNKITDAKVTGIPIGVPEAESAFGSLIPISVDFSSPIFETITVAQGGKLHIALSNKQGNFTSGVYTGLTFSLYNASDDNGVLVGMADSIDLAGEHASGFDIPIQNPLSKSLKIHISGHVYGGNNPLNIVTWSATASFTEDTKIEKVTGLTMTASDLGSDGSVSINQTVSATSDESFVSAKIKKGSLSVKAPLPSGWEGLTCTSELSLSGGITANNSEFEEGSKSGYFMNRTLPLDARTLTGDDITISGTINFALENATLCFDAEGKTPKIQVKPECSIETVEEVTIDTSKKGDFDLTTSYEKSASEVFGSAKDTVKRIKMAKSSIQAQYTNELPEENDIQVAVSSALFGIEGEDSLKAQTQNGTASFEGTTEPEIDTTSEDQKFDFTVKLSLPGATEEHPTYAVLKNITLGSNYTIKMQLEPKFNWTEATVDLSKVSGEGGEIKDTVDMGFSFDSIFSGADGILGEDFVNHINFSSVMMYLYCSKPDFTAFEQISFNGIMKMVSVKETENPEAPENPIESVANEMYVLGFYNEETAEENAQELQFKDFSPLNFSSKNSKIVTTELSSSTASCAADLASFVNGAKSNNLKIAYDLKMGGANGEVTITNDISQEDDESEEDSGTISINARLVIPLSVEIVNTEEEKEQGITNGFDMDIQKFMDKDKNEDEQSEKSDLFKRDKATDFGDAQKFIDILESVTIDYDISNKIFNYTNKSDAKNCKIILNLKEMKESENPLNVKKEEYHISLSNGSLNISMEEFQKWLEYYPFTPNLYLHLPAGKLAIPRDSEFGIGLALKVKANGENPVKIFGD